MKRFLVFAGKVYYPGPGWDDYKGSFDTLEEARAYIPPKGAYAWDWVQYVDTHADPPEEVTP